jgi:hypothetical protein
LTSPGRPTLLALLALFVGGVLGGWWLCGSERRPELPRTSADDDLDLLATILDAGAREPGRDLLLAGATDLYLAHASERNIVAVPKAGGAPRVLARFDAPVWGMAFADAALWVTTGHAVMKIPVSGSEPVLVTASLSSPRAIASDGRWVFVVDLDASPTGMLRKSAVVRVPAAGGDPTVFARSEGEVTNVALDDVDAYWADRLEGSILAVPKTGGAPRALASDRGLPGQLVVDGNALDWVEKRSESLWTMPKTGGAPRRLAQDFAGFASVVVDTRGVWWSSEAAVDGAFRVLGVPGSGGEPSAASAPVDGIDALASDGARLFWARAGKVTPVEAPDDAGR